MLQNYINSYFTGETFTPDGTLTCRVGDAEITVEKFRFERPATAGQIACGGEKAHLTITRGGRKYECDCIDLHHWDPGIFELTLGGRKLLCFRKTLYGFTFLDAQTLTEVYDYFPAHVMEGEESFIICGALSLGELVLFYGCYWACPYSVYVYDHQAKRFADLFLRCRLDFNGDMRIEDGALRVSGTDLDTKETVSVTMTEAELWALLAEKGENGF